jgi:hypothetical protein
LWSRPNARCVSVASKNLGGICPETLAGGERDPVGPGWQVEGAPVELSARATVGSPVRAGAFSAQSR